MVGLPLSRVSFLHKHEEVSSLNDGTTNEYSMLYFCSQLGGSMVHSEECVLS